MTRAGAAPGRSINIAMGVGLESAEIWIERKDFARPLTLLVVIAALDQWSKLWALERLSRAEAWVQYGWGARRMASSR